MERYGKKRGSPIAPELRAEVALLIQQNETYCELLNTVRQQVLNKMAVVLKPLLQQQGFVPFTNAEDAIQEEGNKKATHQIVTVPELDIRVHVPKGMKRAMGNENQTLQEALHDSLNQILGLCYNEMSYGIIDISFSVRTHHGKTDFEVASIGWDGTQKQECFDD